MAEQSAAVGKAVEPHRSCARHPPPRSVEPHAPPPLSGAASSGVAPGRGRAGWDSTRRGRAQHRPPRSGAPAAPQLSGNRTAAGSRLRPAMSGRAFGRHRSPAAGSRRRPACAHRDPRAGAATSPRPPGGSPRPADAAAAPRRQPRPAP
ncbi:uncharacterized protein [Miscanthus floridulus]|uniref:uncharacterized protein n=1 Tax=Miscanthus floridulus TaxID=154761 RepID=UPI0034586372